jgi:hypothetical protein
VFITAAALNLRGFPDCVGIRKALKAVSQFGARCPHGGAQLFMINQELIRYVILVIIYDYRLIFHFTAYY